MRRRVFGHLDPDRLLAGDRREDADVGGGERVGEVVGQLGHLLHLGAGRQAQLVAGDVRAADDADDLRLDPEVAEGLDQLAPDRVMVARVRPSVGLAPLENLGGGRPVVDLLGGRHSTHVAHRRQRRLLGDGIRADTEALFPLHLNLVRHRVKILRHGLGLVKLIVDKSDGRLEIVPLGIRAHHIRRPGLGLKRVGLLLPPGLSALDHGLRPYPAHRGKPAATPRPTPRKSAEIEVPVTSNPPTTSIEHGDDPRPNSSKRDTRARSQPRTQPSPHPSQKTARRPSKRRQR